MEPALSHDGPSDAPVLYRLDGSVATITLNRPRQMNSLDTQTKEALLATLSHAAKDPEARCVVLTGAGAAFCVGQDLKEHVTNLAEKSLDDVWATVKDHYRPIALAIATMDKPVIAAVNGVAAGAGMSIAMLCDIRVAAESASFNTAFTAVGLACDTGCSWTLPRLVGHTKAMELLLMPRSVRASEALEIGLVTSVVPADDLASAVSELAERLAAGPTLAYAAVRRSALFGAAHTLADTMYFEASMMAWTGATTDHRRAAEAFLAKERPVFEGA